MNTRLTEIIRLVIVVTSSARLSSACSFTCLRTSHTLKKMAIVASPVVIAPQSASCCSSVSECFSSKTRLLDMADTARRVAVRSDVADQLTSIPSTPVPVAHGLVEGTGRSSYPSRAPIADCATDSGKQQNLASGIVRLVSSHEEGHLGEDSQGGESAADLTLKTLVAVGTGVGALGFVTLFGGAILWVRAEKAGRPDEAVAAVPKGVLVTTGAEFLVPAVLGALFVVTVIAAIHLVFSLPTKIQTTKERRIVRKTQFKANQAEHDAVAKRAAAKSIEERLNRLRRAANEAAEADDPQHADLQAVVESQETEFQSRSETARQAAISAEKLKTEASAHEAELEHTEANPPWLDTTEWWVERGAALVVLVAVPLILYGDPSELSGSRPTVLVLVAVTAAAVSLAIYLTTESFLWFGIAAFFAVGVYAGFATYYRTTDTLKVQPAAALRTGHAPVAGFFIAETSDNYYLGSFRYGEHRPQLRIIPRAQITDVAVSPLLALSEARVQAFRMAKLACHQLVTKSGVTHPVHACSKKQEVALIREATAS